MKKILLFLLPFIFSIPGLVAEAAELTLRNYSEVVVDNLPVGMPVSLLKAVNLPLIVINQDEQPNMILIEVLKPQPDKIKSGYEAISDTAWIAIDKKEAEIPANGKLETDVTISVPNELEFINKKFQADVRARVIPKGNGPLIALAVQGRILFSTIASDAAGPEVVRKSASMNFDLVPVRLVMKDVPLGRKVTIKDGKGNSVVIQNHDSEKMRFYLQTLNPKDTVLTPESGYEACPSPDYLLLDKDELVVNGRGEKPIRMSLKIPDQPEYRGKSFLFVVSVKTGAATTGIRYEQILVTTAWK